jgi:hypothetical protein
VRKYCKAQSYVEYVLLAIVGLAILLFLIAPLMHNTSTYIVLHAPKPNNMKATPNMTGVDKEYLDKFSDEFKKLLDDPAAKDCVDEIAAITDKLAAIESGDLSGFTTEEVTEMLYLISHKGANAMHSTWIMDTASCSAFPPAAEVINVLDKTYIKIEPQTKVCADECTITTGTNTVVQHIETLINNGTITSNILTSCSSVPITSAELSTLGVSGVIDKYFYGYSKYDRYTAIDKISNTLGLLECIKTLPGLPSSVQDNYDKLVDEVKEGLTVVTKSNDPTSSASTNKVIVPSASKGTIEYCL